jgi:hypothetical protein
MRLRIAADASSMVTPHVSEIERRLEPTVTDDFAGGLALELVRTVRKTQSKPDDRKRQHEDRPL